MEWTGGCLCRSVRYRVEAEPLWICHCHCNMCKKQTGSAFATFIGFPRESFHWTKGKVTFYCSSTDVQRGFCGECGGSLTFHRVHETSVAVGSLDHPEKLDVGGPRPVYQDNHIFIGEQVPWLTIDDDLDRFTGRPPGRDEELEELSGTEMAAGE